MDSPWGHKELDMTERLSLSREARLNILDGFSFFFLILTYFLLKYSFFTMSVSAVQQRESVIHAYIYLHS